LRASDFRPSARRDGADETSWKLDKRNNPQANPEGAKTITYNDTGTDVTINERSLVVPTYLPVPKKKTHSSFTTLD